MLISGLIHDFMSRLSKSNEFHCSQAQDLYLSYPFSTAVPSNKRKSSQQIMHIRLPFTICTMPQHPILQKYKNLTPYIPHLTYVLKSTPPLESLQYQQYQPQHQAMELHFEPNSPLFRILSDRQDYNYQGEIEMLHDSEYRWNDAASKNFNFQIEEIISKFTLSSPLAVIEQPQPQNIPMPSENQARFYKTPFHSDSIRKKQKKIKKTENSPFHNYQKHLNNALKKLIIVPEFQPNCQQYKKAAIQIWNIYCRCDIKTKRILHFIFNEKNEHTINEPQLKTYRLWNVYKTYQPDIITKAKNYLSKLAIDQLDEQNVEGYLKTRKLKKNRDGFKEYILGFKSQLEKGYLKRRVIGEKVQSDQ